MIAADDAGGFERADAAERRRRGKPGARGEIDVGEPPLILKAFQNDPVSFVDNMSIRRHSPQPFNDLLQMVII